MSRNITTADLNEALRPLIEAINKSREENLSNSTQVSEVHRMLTAISLKIDEVDKAVTTASAVPTRTTGKKLVGRKGVGEKKPAKRGAKKVSEPVEDDADADAGGDDDADADAGGDDADAGDDSENKTGGKSTKPGKTIKKSVATKKPAQKPTKPAAKKPAAKKPVAPKKKQFNKMNFFKKEFEADEKQFYKVLTAKVRASVESDAENAEKLKPLEGDALKKARANIYYHYLKDNHPAVLDGLRGKFDAEVAAEENEAKEGEDDDVGGDADDADAGDADDAGDGDDAVDE